MSQSMSNRRCSVDGCDGKYSAKGYCTKHRIQIWRYGEIKERTWKDLNTYWFDGDICFIQIYDKFSNPKCEVMVDTEDYEKVKGYKWCISTNGEILNNSIGYLSRFIMQVGDSHVEVDHKFHNRLDNRKVYLRICTRAQNGANKGKQSNNTSGFKGVSRHSTNNKWVATISINHKVTYLGSFDTKEEAALAYNKAAKEIYGEFALLNIMK